MRCVGCQLCVIDSFSLGEERCDPPQGNNTAWSQRGQAHSLHQLCLYSYSVAWLKGKVHLWYICSIILKEKSSNLILYIKPNSVLPVVCLSVCLSFFFSFLFFFPSFLSFFLSLFSFLFFFLFFFSFLFFLFSLLPNRTISFGLQTGCWHKAAIVFAIILNCRDLFTAVCRCLGRCFFASLKSC